MICSQIKLILKKVGNKNLFLELLYYYIVTITQKVHKIVM